MADLLALSRHIIDTGVVDSGTGPTNRLSNELSEIADDLAVVESFSHCVAWKTSEGLACFDASGVITGPLVVKALNKWTSTPVSHLIYTHGHADHIGGSPAFAAAAGALSAALNLAASASAIKPPNRSPYFFSVLTLTGTLTVVRGA